MKKKYFERVFVSALLLQYTGYVKEPYYMEIYFYISTVPWLIYYFIGGIISILEVILYFYYDRQYNAPYVEIT